MVLNASLASATSLGPLAAPDADGFSYEQVIEDDAVLEGFLQRCVFDSELSLEAMREDEILGAYLAARRDEAGRSRFRQDVSMIFIRR